MSTDSPSTESVSAETGFRKKNIGIIVFAFAILWFMAIASESLVFMIIAGILTLIAAGLGFWVWRMVKRHQGLAAVLQGAANSPEERKKALAKLEAQKKPNDPSNIIARAQLLATDEPNKALELLEPLDLKSVPPNMQDDFSLLKSQLLLGFGRAKQARPLVDSINLDNPQRKDMRPYMMAIVGETWARTGSAKEANELLDSIDPKEVAKANAETVVLSARVFARFAAGKKGRTREALMQLAAVDPNLLGRFISPKSKVHPGLQRLAREAFERNGAGRRQGRQHVAAGGRGRRR